MPEEDNPRWITFAEAEERFGGGGGSLPDQEIAVGTGTGIGSSPDLKYDGSSGVMLVGTDSHAFGIEIDSENGQLRFVGDGFGFGRESGAGQHLTVGDPSSGVGIKVDDTVTLNLEGGGKSAQLYSDAFDVSGVPVRLGPVADPPASPQEGMLYADTDHHLYYYNGTTWKQLDN